MQITTTTLTIAALIIWTFGMLFVSGYLQRVYLKYKSGRKVPAIELRDDVDFYPAKPSTLFGDHWASIAGGAPLAGGATGPIWGFLPAFLYTTFGNIFLGSPHDYATMHLSMRKKGKTIGGLIQELISQRAGKMGVFLGWFSIAAFTAVVDILPVLGTGLVLIPWALFHLIKGNLSLGLGLVLIYVVITVIRNVLEPKLVGQQIGLHPIVMLLCMYAGVRIFGVIGLFILPFSILVIKYLYDHGKLHPEA